MKKNVNNTLYYASKYNTYALVFMLLFFAIKLFIQSFPVSLAVTTTVYFVLLRTKLIVIGSPWNKQN